MVTYLGSNAHGQILHGYHSYCHDIFIQKLFQTQKNTARTIKSTHMTFNQNHLLLTFVPVCCVIHIFCQITRQMFYILNHFCVSCICHGLLLLSTYSLGPIIVLILVFLQSLLLCHVISSVFFSYNIFKESTPYNLSPSFQLPLCFCLPSILSPPPPAEQSVPHLWFDISLWLDLCMHLSLEYCISDASFLEQHRQNHVVLICFSLMMLMLVKVLSDFSTVYSYYVVFFLATDKRSILRYTAPH